MWGQGQGQHNSKVLVLTLLPPGLIVAALAVLIVSQLFFAFLPFRRRAYLPILLMTAIGFGLGQLCDYIGLPSPPAAPRGTPPRPAPSSSPPPPRPPCRPPRSREPKEPNSSKPGGSSQP